MATELTKVKRKRTTKKNIVDNQIIPECEKILAGNKDEESSADALVLLSTLTETANEVKDLDERVSELTVDDGEYDKNEKEAYDFLLRTRKMESKLQAFLDKDRDVKPRISTVPNSFGPVGVKLPKIKIKTFEGNAVNWK